MVTETPEQEQKRKEDAAQEAARLSRASGIFGAAADPSSQQGQPLGFDQLNPMQQGLAMLFFFMAMLLDPEKMKGMGLDSMFGSILGLDPNKGETFEKWQGQAREQGQTPDSLAHKQDYNKFDFKKADELRRSNIPMADLIRKDGPALLHPDLVARMEKDPKVKDYVQYTLEAAKRNGLDGTLLANQFWQESRFNPRAGSGAGAKGIAQFIDSTGAQYGLNRSNIYDPYKSIDAGARHMKDLTNKFGSQELALAAYNGGGGSVNYVQKSLGKKDITVGDWMGFMADQRARLGVGSSNLWRNQTFDYIAKISPAYWSDGQRTKAQAAMERAGLSSPGKDERVAQASPDQDNKPTSTPTAATQQPPATSPPPAKVAAAKESTESRTTLTAANQELGSWLAKKLPGIASVFTGKAAEQPETITKTDAEPKAAATPKAPEGDKPAATATVATATPKTPAPEEPKAAPALAPA